MSEPEFNQSTLKREMEAEKRGFPVDQKRLRAEAKKLRREQEEAAKNKKPQEPVADIEPTDKAFDDRPIETTDEDSSFRD